MLDSSEEFVGEEMREGELDQVKQGRPLSVGPEK